MTSVIAPDADEGPIARPGLAADENSQIRDRRQHEQRQTDSRDRHAPRRCAACRTQQPHGKHAQHESTATSARPTVPRSCEEELPRGNRQEDHGQNDLQPTNIYAVAHPQSDARTGDHADHGRGPRARSRHRRESGISRGHRAAPWTPITAALVAAATRFGTPHHELSTGTTITPPPSPVSDDTMPAAPESAIATGSRCIRYTTLSRCRGRKNAHRTGRPRRCRREECCGDPGA